MGNTFSMAASERRRLADDLDGISETQWTTASLCAGWQVRDVVAHLVAHRDVSAKDAPEGRHEGLQLRQAV